jgi:UDP-N-acetyl-2-amino-2-deoxyglucuronate dehydrogenase
MKRIRCALAGLGHIAQSHLQAMAACADELELVAVCDTAQEKADELAQALSVAAYADLHSMLKEVKPDLLALCTPHGLHAAQGMLAAEQGCHVLMEKPLALREDDGVALIDAFGRRKLHLMVAMQLRLLPSLALLKELIDARRLGRIAFIQCNLFWARALEYYSGSNWRGTKEHDGGLFTNQALHALDMMQWLLGPVQAVQGAAATLVRRIETEDTGAVMLRWKHGAIGSLNATVLAYPRSFETSLTVIGEKGTLRLSGNLQRFDHWEVEGLEPPEAMADVHGHTLYYQHALRVLRGEEAPVVTGEEALATLRLANAIRTACAAGETIQLTENAS